MAINYDAPTEQEIETALSFVPSDDREIWYRMAFAIRDELGDAGFDIWDRWSTGSKDYDAKAAKATWKSSSGKGVTISSLFKLARDFGYRREGKPQSISEDEYLARKARREADAELHAIELAEQHKKAAARAAKLYASAKPALLHPYASKKGIVLRDTVHTGTWTRTDPETGEIFTIDDALLIPIRTLEKRGPVSLQAYFPDANNPLGRDRDYLPGGEKSGGFFPLLPLKKDYSDTIVICEGWATGEKINAATAKQTIIAFDAGNLPAVAEAVRTMYLDNPIVIAADDDRYHDSVKKRNAGLCNAVDAANAINALVAVPVFTDYSSQPTDFDDMARLSGLESVAECIANAVSPNFVDTKTDIQRSFIVAKSPENNIIELNTYDQESNKTPVQVITHKSRYDLSQVDWFSEFPDVNGKGKPLETISNIEEALRRMRVTVRYNVISKDLEIMIPDEGYSVDNRANASFAWVLSALVQFGIPTGKLQDYLCNIGDRNQYNPVANWITSKPWDGESRLAAFIDTIKAEGEITGDLNCPIWNLKYALILRWMISACAAAFRPNGVSAAGVLVLQGSQYLGKTMWFKSLVPEHLSVIQDGLSLRPDDRDSVKKVVSYWLVELGELDATFRKSDISALKAFLTLSKDVMRRAYARNESEYARRTVFFASVNPRQFLHDPTGNRRYWTISCSDINHSHGLDMQQVWAEVYQEYYKKGTSWYLTQEENDALNAQNRDYEVVDPIEERINSRMDWGEPQSLWTWKSATDVMQELGFDRPTKGDVTQCSQVIAKQNGEKRKKVQGQRLLLVPPIKRIL